MKLYRHYKNHQLYQVCGVAAHSETLDNLVVYQTLYNNPVSKLWVRPKSMFEEELLIDGQIVPRFAPIPVTVTAYNQLDETQQQILTTLCADYDFAPIATKADIYLLIAYLENQPIAFKLGYRLNETCFDNCLDFVSPKYGEAGVLEHLTGLQHQWCRSHGYTKVQHCV